MRNLKLIGAIVVVIGALGFLYHRDRTVRPPQEALMAQPAFGRAAPGSPPSPDEGKRMREEMLRDLGVTAEQRAKIEAIDKKHGRKTRPEVMRQRMTEMAEVLTPEQRQKARERMEASMSKRLQKVLPPGELQKLRRRVEERFDRGEPPFGPPPPGAPPR